MMEHPVSDSRKFIDGHVLTDSTYWPVLTGRIYLEIVLAIWRGGFLQS